MNHSNNNAAQKPRSQKKGRPSVIKDKKLLLAALRIWELNHRN
jgi:hypothetical protein